MLQRLISAIQRCQLAREFAAALFLPALIAAPSADSAVRSATVPRVALAQRSERTEPVGQAFPFVWIGRPFPANLADPLGDPPAPLLTNVSPRMSVHSWPPVHGPCPVTCVTRQGLSWLGHEVHLSHFCANRHSFSPNCLSINSQSDSTISRCLGTGALFPVLAFT